MRITFVLPDDNPSGGVRVVAIYAERLRRRGHTVCVVSTRPQRQSIRDAMRTLIKKGRWPFRARAETSYFDGLEVEHRVLPHTGPLTDADVPEADIIVATWWKTAEWIWALAPSRGRRVHFMQHYESWSAPPEVIDAVYQLPIPKIVLTDWLRDLVRERFFQEPLALVPNSVDLGLFTAPPRGKHSTPTIGMTYFTIAEKGSDISIRAVELARREAPSLRLISMGYVPVAPELPLPDGTEFHHLPPQSMLPRIYANCDAWLFGSRTEGFGLPILEAMACRTPVIGTPAGAAPELLKKGGGILVPQEDPQAMADAILQIARMHDASWRALSDRAFATVASYTWDDATDRFELALKAAASGDSALTPCALT
jgi:glycosyltransferase involved in cell wall biosynthesis